VTRFVPETVERKTLEAGKRVWQRLPARVRDLYPVQIFGRGLYALTTRYADREMYLGTQFLRNRPELELIGRLVDRRPRGATIRIAVLGCSVGVEVYSIAWTLRRARPDLTLVTQAVDIAPEAIAIGREGVYGPRISELVHSSIFDGLSRDESDELFDWEGDEARVKPGLREGITWLVGDAGDPELVEQLGPQDLVIANNFLCHLDRASAERCLRNLARLVRPGGHVFVTGVDLDLRAKVAADLGWVPVAELLPEIHDGDPLVRADWPLQWWGLEPLDRRRRNWQLRYAAAFQVTAD
jgi:SAM-dependent methyltransferase